MARFAESCAFDTTFAADKDPTKLVLFAVPVYTVELTVADTDVLPKDTVVLFAITLFDEDPITIANELIYASEFTAMIESLTVVVPILISEEDMFAEVVEFAILNNVELITVLIVELPTNTAVVFWYTFAPVATTVELTVDVPILRSIAVKLDVDVLFFTDTILEFTIVLTVELVETPIVVAFALVPADAAPNPAPVVCTAALTVPVVHTPVELANVAEAILALVAAYTVAVFT